MSNPDLHGEQAMYALTSLTLDELMAMCRTFDHKFETATLTPLDMALWSVATALIDVRYAEQRLQAAWSKVALEMADCIVVTIKEQERG